MTSLERPADEAVNLATHGFGLALSLAASAWLMRSVTAAGDARTIWACGVYCFTLITLYSASTLSHAFRDINRRRLLRTFDQASIFLVMPGTFTPFAVSFLTRGWWQAALPVMWALALAGIVMVLRRRDLSRRAKFTYGALGWTPLFSLGELYRNGSPDMVWLIVAGGLLYSFGSIFLLLGKKIRYLHALWHLFVIAASACHYFAIAAYVAAR